MDKTLLTQNALTSKETKHYKRDVAFLFVVIFAYLLCVVPKAGGLPQYMRYVILPLFIIAAYLRVGIKMRMDFLTVVLFIFAVVPSILFSPYRTNALVKAITVLLMFVGVSLYFSSRENFGLSALYRALLFIGYVVVLVSIFRYVCGQGFHGGYFRGYFGNRNAAGPTFVITGMIFLAEMFRRKGYKKILPLIFFVLDVFMTIETQSRGSFVGLIIGLVVFLFFAYKKKARFIAIVGVLLILVTIFWGRISEWGVVKRILEDGLTRDDLWNEARRIIKNNFFVGVGFSSSAFSNQSAGNENMNFHNSYVSLMADIGLFGVICVALIFILLFIKIAKNYKRVKKEERLCYVAFLAIALAFFGLSFGESYLIVAGSPFSFIFWCIMFCMSEYVPKRLKKKKQKEKLNGK